MSIMKDVKRVRQFFRRKIGSKPVGIWVAWVALVYTLILELWRLATLWEMPFHRQNPANTDALLGLIILFPAMVFLFLRRLIACVFVGMSLLLMLRTAILHAMPFGILLAVFGFFGVIANRKWFDEYLPPAD